MSRSSSSILLSCSSKALFWQRAVDIGSATHDVVSTEINMARGSYKTARQIVSFYDESDAGMEIVGVTADTRGSLSDPLYSTIYYPSHTGMERGAE